MDLPLIELIITDDECTGVDYVALVDNPAIQRMWRAFAHPQVFKIADVERKMVMGPIMVANQPIYRNDGGREYYVVFSQATIEKITRRFMRNGFTGNVNKNHNMRMIASGCYMIESFMIDSTRGMHTPDGFATLPDGSWFGTYCIEDPETWESVKRGEFTGFSVEGMFEEIAIDHIQDVEAEELIQMLTNLY